MFRLNYIVSVLCLLCSTVVSQHSFAWGQDGHRAICDLAYESMHIITKKEIKRLLKEMPSIHKQQINQHLGRSKRADISYGDACVWADTLRNDPQYMGFRTWHYVNVERDANSVDSEHCLQGCVLEAIPLHHRVLSDSSNSWQKLQALMFLGHWIGDIHQPLHVGFVDDRGGNLLRIRIGDLESNFHKLWDTDIIDWMMQLNGWDVGALIDNIRETNIMGYDTGFGVNAAAMWAEESRNIAQAPSTQYCERRNDECRKPKGRPPYRLDSAYFSLQWPTVRVRMKLAAERTARAVDEAMN